MSLNQSMNISLGSMKNNQYALTVVSQNIANLHVEGYVKQRVNFQTNEYTTKCENVIQTIRGMNGASITSLTDYIDEGAFGDVIRTNADANYYNTLADALSGLEDIADDLGDSGLNGLLNEFFTASANLEKYPTDYAIRQQFNIAAENICDKFNDISTKYTDIQEDKFQNVQTEVDKINSLIHQLATINEAHIKKDCSTETQSQINSILKELSNYTDVVTQKNQNGSYNLYIGDVAVVEGTEAKYKLGTSFDPNDPDGALSFNLQSIEDPSYTIERVNDSFKSGSLKAYIEFLNGGREDTVSVQSLKGALDSAANAFATALNNIQTYDDGNIFAACLAPDPVTGELILDRNTENYFVSSDGNAINASNIKVSNVMINNPNKIAAARIDLADFTDKVTLQVDPNWIKAIGNSDNAVLISGLQNQKICTNPDGSTCTLSQFLINTASKTGQDVANLQDTAGTYQDIADNSNNNFVNMIGVNLDEELSDMIRYQRAYEASARLFSTINDLMGTIINLV